MPHCDKFVSLFPDYIDKLLTGTEKEKFEQHLLQCADCSETVEQMKALKRQLKALPKVHTSPAFHVVLHSRIRRELERPSIWDQLWGFLQNYRLPAYAAAAAAVILMTVLSYYWFIRPDQTSPVSETTRTMQTATVPYAATQSTEAPNEQIYFVIEKMPVEELLRSEQNLADRSRLDRLDSSVDSSQFPAPIPVKIFRAAHATSVTF